MTTEVGAPSVPIYLAGEFVRAGTPLEVRNPATGELLATTFKAGVDELERAITAAVEAIGLPTSVQGVEVARIMDLLSYDKKRDARGIRMVLLRGIGRPTIEHVELADIEVGLGAVGL